MKTDMICIATPKWYGNYLKSTVQLMEYLTETHRILYVDYPYTWIDIARGLFGKKDIPALRILGFKKRLQSIQCSTGENINLLRLPPLIPSNWIRNPGIHDIVSKINAALVSRVVNKYARRLQMSEPVVVNAFQPNLGRWLKGRFGESKLVYYCYDNIGAARWLSKHGARVEREFIQMADQVIVTSNGLSQNKMSSGTPICVVRNGVDYDLFARELPQSSNGSKKVVGYLGTIDDRIDVKMLSNVIEELDNVEFRFVGRCTHHQIRSAFEAYPNVTFTGPKHKSLLAGEIEAMDCCIIPFVQNDFTRAIYPLKINEYLSRGKPVVTTNFADLTDFYGLIYSANSCTSFTSMLQAALAEDDETLRTRRKAFARTNSWQARAREFARALRA